MLISEHGAKVLVFQFIIFVCYSSFAAGLLGSAWIFAGRMVGAYMSHFGIDLGPSMGKSVSGRI